jgi:hypothetical protein
MEGAVRRPVDFYGRGYLPGLPSLSLHYFLSLLFKVQVVTQFLWGNSELNLD